MLITTLKSKISYATITQKDLYYVGSITIDEEIMEKANIRENEKYRLLISIMRSDLKPMSLMANAVLK